MATAALAERFEEQRPRLRAVAYRMLGSPSDADDVVQEAWLRLQRATPSGVENLGGWLTTVVARLCLDALRSRASGREEHVGLRLPEPIVNAEDSEDPEQVALVAGGVGLALQIVLDALGPAERIAFVLHDIFAVPFEEIAPVVGRSPEAARQLASRARRRVRGAPAAPPDDRTAERRVVDAFLAASRAGDLDALLAVLDPEAIVRVEAVEAAGGVREIRGARAAAEEAIAGAARAARTVPVRVNGAPGLVALDGAGEPFALLCFAITGGRIVELDVLTDPDRVRRLHLRRFAGPSGQR